MGYVFNPIFALNDLLFFGMLGGVVATILAFTGKWSTRDKIIAGSVAGVGFLGWVLLQVREKRTAADYRFGNAFPLTWCMCDDEGGYIRVPFGSISKNSCSCG